MNLSCIFHPLEPRRLASVAIQMRYGEELAIASDGAANIISLSQNGQMLNIVANGKASSFVIPAGGVFVYPHGDSDSVFLDKSVRNSITVESIDNASETITCRSHWANIWVDSSDIVSGFGHINAVDQFAGGVSDEAGVSLPNPSDSGQAITVTGSLFGTAPIADDVNQGGVGDCGYMAAFASFASTNPLPLRWSAVDMGDGTYAVRYFDSHKNAVFVRVSDQFPAGFFPGGLADAHLGASGNLWPLVLEKAYAYFDLPQFGVAPVNTYASLAGGGMWTVYWALGDFASNNFSPSQFTESSFDAMASAALSARKPITLATPDASTLVPDHAYTLVSITPTPAGEQYIVRNPWGISGDALEDSRGYAVLDWAELQSEFQFGTVG